MKITFQTLHSSVCTEKGYTFTSKEGQYARGALTSALNNWHNLPPMPVGFAPGMSRKEQKAAQRNYDQAKAERISKLNHIAVRENAAAAGLDPAKADWALSTREKWGLVVGSLILLIGGPMYLFITVICAVGSWIIEGELEERYGPHAISQCAASFRVSQG